MGNLTAAKEARLKTLLNKKMRFSGSSITCYREEIEKGLFIRSEEAQVPSVRYNRRRYNRMNQAEQDIYDIKMKKMKSEYRLYIKGGSFYEVPKMIFDYYNENSK